MQAEAKDEWMFEEPTVAEEEREAVARLDMSRAIAQLVHAAVPVAAVLVVSRGPGLPTGVVIRDGESALTDVLDPVVLAELLAAGGDDQIVAATARLVLGDGDVVEHAVARDRRGAIQGVIVVKLRGRAPKSWLRTVLSRAADALAGWLSTELAWPPETLLEAISEPALVHDAGIVLVANAAIAALLGRSRNDVIGMPVSRIVQRFRTLRTCAVVVGGRPRTALILDGRPRTGPETSLAASVERVVATYYAFVRQTARLSIDTRESTEVAVSQRELDEIVAIALLDTVALYVAAAPTNHVRLAVRADGTTVTLELVASGAISAAPDVGHLGATICDARARALGGHCLVDVSSSDLRTLRITLPVAA